MKLSIITICFNEKAGIERTIKSVLSQSWRDFEYIVIDGGSTDGTVDIIKKYQEQITHFISEKDSGVPNAMNKGLRMASGEYCMFLNGDDRLADDKVLEKVFHQNFTEDIVYGDILCDKGPGKPLEIKSLAGVLITPRFFITASIPHPGAFVKKKLFTEHGFFDERFKICADHDVFVREIVKNGATLKYIPVTVSIFEMGRGGLSTSWKNKNLFHQERIYIQKKYINIRILSKNFFTNFFYRLRVMVIKVICLVKSLS